MRFLHGTTINPMRTAEGAPICELIVFHHEGSDGVNHRNPGEFRVWFDRAGLRNLIGALGRYLEELEAMPELVPTEGAGEEAP